ncbi:class I adenylate-forming enzyme family protein [Aquisalimonas asiatica]|uniref:O-succinylbenzoic acid--CoA ligase n=1 Tax=Aquisalimonas asiatica TaxID=406100 RepID=A0A1H8V0U5_9GAMM|nr:AMP-binding protein [Aquisalimonas asiatica]SEP09029.1 O-succinylbenzoic acid--CoA ligase [Aquisalimonas asiatica]
MWATPVVPEIAREHHYGDRVVHCFRERPDHLNRLLPEALARVPDNDALVHGDRRLTYRALDEQVGKVAAGLAACGVGAGDRVALILGNRIEFVVLVLATWRLGAVAVPLNTRDSRSGYEHALGDSGALVLVHEPDVRERLPDNAALPGLAHRICTTAFDRLLQHGGRREPAAVAEEDVAAILYTSGTTGRPKGAMLTHLGIIHSLMHFTVCMGLEPGERSLITVPLSHVTGLVALMGTCLHAAGTLIIQSEFKARAFLELAARERMTHTVLVPAMYNLCLLDPAFDRFDLSAWRIGGYGGAPMPEVTIGKLAERLPDLQLMNAYGATETSSPVTMMPPAETGVRGDSIGVALPCARVAIMDDDGREVARGQPGELWVAGPMVVPGYWNNREATAREFTGGFWRSGDIGSMDADGFVYVFDRKKDMINRGGYKVFTTEVENVMLAHPGVAEVAVIGTPCPVLGERVHAFVVPTGSGLDESALLDHCAAELSDYKVPEGVILRQEPLPRNPNGKVLKRALRDAFAAQRSGGHGTG